MDPSEPLNEPRRSRGFWWGVVGGLLGSLILIRYFPTVIPVDKRQVLVQESSAVVEVAKKVSPSVVSITSKTEDNFFRGTTSQTGAGTGIVLTDDGLILTNKHVVPNDDSSLSVFTSDGREYKNARVVARDAFNDIAFIRISARGLKPAELGDSSQINVGQKVVAIGNALGQFQNTVTEGIISGIGRPVLAADETGLSAESLENLLQTDAAINPGNSGGPLVNIEGQVIGINTAVAGDAQSVGFAIPINEAKAQIASVREKGRIVRAYLGVRYVQITKEYARQNNLKTDEGALVVSSGGEPAVIEGGPADRAGVKDKDIIIQVGRDRVTRRNSLSSLVSKYKVGEKVDLILLRAGKELKLRVTLEEASG